jgi:hypothetical protein
VVMAVLPKHGAMAFGMQVVVEEELQADRKV